MLIVEGYWRMEYLFFFFNDTATTEIYTLSLHDALPISPMHNEPEGMISGEMILCFVLLYMYNNNLLLHWAGIMIMYSKR